jgi:uncharacterized membrane protein
VADNARLVLAFYESEEAAEGAAAALRGWARSNRPVQLEAVGVLAKDDQGQVKTDKLGPARGRTGVGVGAVLGAVAANGLGLGGDDVARIGARLDAGHAAVGALVPPNQAAAIGAELQALGGEPEVHELAGPEVAGPEVTDTGVTNTGVTNAEPGVPAG